MALPEILTVDLGPGTHIRLNPRAAGTDHWDIRVYIGEAKCRHHTLMRVHVRFGWMENSEANSFSHTPHLFPSPFPLKLTNNSPRHFPAIWAPPKFFCVFLSWHLPYSPFSLAKTDSASCLLLGVRSRGREVMPSKALQ